MAYLNREQYDRRRENAEERNARNEVIAVTNGIGEHEAELISELCRIRHNMHCNIASLVNDTSNSSIEKDLVSIHDRINASTLPHISYGKYDRCDEGCLDIEDIQSMYEYEDVPEEDAERQDWYDENYARIYNDWEALNDIIEEYLRNDIDKKYGTSFAPTGVLRLL